MLLSGRKKHWSTGYTKKRYSNPLGQNGGQSKHVLHTLIRAVSWEQVVGNHLHKNLKDENFQPRRASLIRKKECVPSIMFVGAFLGA